MATVFADISQSSSRLIATRFSLLRGYAMQFTRRVVHTEGIWCNPNSSRFCNDAEGDIMIDEKKLQQFLEKMMFDLGAAMSVPLVRIGVRLGLYEAMNGVGPISGHRPLKFCCR
jgi:hypothetical protein